MPQVQLGKPIGPIAVTATLNGSGAGTVSFQPNGCTARITNLFVKCSTSASQAVAKIYRGQISDNCLINQTNSGSTGAAASGVIDVSDGETLFVVWSGGDAGATATATFVGMGIPFNQRTLATQLVWDNPIAANDGSLVFPAIKSINYVAGVSGWIIDRNGNAEFADGTFRGDLVVTSPTGAQVKIYILGAAPAAGDPAIEFTPDPLGGHVITPGYAYAFSSAGSDTVGLNIEAPTIDGIGTARIALNSSSTSGETFGAMYADEVFISSLLEPLNLISDGNTMKQWDGGVVSGNVAIGSSSAVFNNLITFNYPYTSAPSVVLTLDSASGNFGRWTARVFNITATNASVILEKGAAADAAMPATTGFNLNWVAMGS